MQFVLTYLRFHRATVLAMALVLLLALVVLVLAQFRPQASVLTLLGDTAATRPTAPAAQAYPPAAARPIAAALPTPASDYAVESEPDAMQEAPLIAALACARTQMGQPALSLDPDLSREAAALWHALAQQSGSSLAQVAGNRYALVTVLPLTLAQDGEVVPGACIFGGLDLAQLDLAGLSRVGVAVFPDPTPLDGLEDSSAVIVAQ